MKERTFLIFCTCNFIIKFGFLFFLFGREREEEVKKRKRNKCKQKNNDIKFGSKFSCYSFLLFRRYYVGEFL